MVHHQLVLNLAEMDDQPNIEQSYEVPFVKKM